MARPLKYSTPTQIVSVTLPEHAIQIVRAVARDHCVSFSSALVQILEEYDDLPEGLLASLDEQIT